MFDLIAKKPGRFLIGWLWEKLSVPPMVERVEISADKIGCYVKIRTSKRYTVIQIDGVELFFNRESGAYDGYGSIRVGQEAPMVVI